MLRTWYFVLLRLVTCLYILCTTTTGLLLLLLWLLPPPPLDRYSGKAILPCLPSISHGFSCSNPCELRSPISFPSRLSSLLRLRCVSVRCSTHSPSLHHQRPYFVLTCLFWALLLLLLGRTSFVRPRVARLNLPLQLTSRDSGAPIHHVPTTIFETLLFLFYDIIHTPSPPPLL